MKQLKIKPFADQGHYTEFHNEIIDRLMPVVGGSAWLVLTLIIRKTKGWRKRNDKISYSQIRLGTGIKSDQTVFKALKKLLDIGCITKTCGDSQFDGSKYGLNRDFEMPSTTENVVEKSTTDFEEATTETVAEPTTENVAAATTETVDTKATNKNPNNKTVNNGRVGTGRTHAPDPPKNQEIAKVSPLHPEPRLSADTRALAGICGINVLHPKPADCENWGPAVSTIRASMPDATPDERAAAVRAFRGRWRNGVPYLSQVVSQWNVIMNDLLIDGVDNEQLERQLQPAAPRNLTARQYAEQEQLRILEEQGLC